MVATAEGGDDLFSHIDDDLQLPEVGVLSVDQLPQGLLLVQSLASQRLCVCVCVCVCVCGYIKITVTAIENHVHLLQLH